MNLGVIVASLTLHSTKCNTVLFLPVFSKRDDKVLALPLAVGSKTDHPVCKATCAACWTVGRILAALAR